jgi:hypothetical protein
VTVYGDNITHPQPFNCSDTVGVGNGAGLIIKNTGFSHVCSNSFTKFHLKDIVHYPNASTNLLSTINSNRKHFTQSLHDNYEQEWRKGIAMSQPSRTIEEASWPSSETMHFERVTLGL